MLGCRAYLSPRDAGMNLAAILRIGAGWKGAGIANIGAVRVSVAVIVSVDKKQILRPQQPLQLCKGGTTCSAVVIQNSRRNHKQQRQILRSDVLLGIRKFCCVTQLF
jgi:hypothetical protein